MLRTTPFHPRVEPLNTTWAWRRWAGHAVASQYGPTHEPEYYAIRSGAALIDVSPLYKYAITGPDAERFLSYLLLRDIRTCRVGRAHYTAWCNEDGHVLEDGVVFRLAPDVYHLTAAEPNLNWLCANAEGLRVTVEDISEAFGIVAVQGPNAAVVVQAALDDGSIATLRPFAHTTGVLGGAPVRISRTGYTGDLGYEIWAPSAESPHVWDRLVAAGRGHGVRPAGMLALDLARIEAGLLLLDADYTSARFAHIPEQKSTPLELGFGWMVRALDRDDERRFIGRNAIQRERGHGPQWRFVGLELDATAYRDAFSLAGLSAVHNTVPQRSSIPLYDGGAYVGYASSHVYSPLLKQQIALASVHAHALDTDGDAALRIEITVEHQRLTVPARIVPLPFFDPPRRRALPILPPT